MGKYDYQKLPTGVCNSTNIFQENISELIKGFDKLRTYIDDVLSITKNDFKVNLNALEKELQRITEAGLRVNSKNHYLYKHKLSISVYG